MKNMIFLTLALVLVLAGACKEKDSIGVCDSEFPEGTRYFEFGHRSSDYTFYAWTADTAVLAHVDAQLALPEIDRGQHINGKIAKLGAGCNLNKDWSWYFPAEDWDVVDISIELCDGNPQYVEDHLEDYLAIDQYCPWGSYVLREIDSPL